MENFQQLFSQGKVSGLSGLDGEFSLVETQISHILLFQDLALKRYKTDNAGYNKTFIDLSNKETRAQFFKEDFFFNHYYNPDVYIKLMGLKEASDLALELTEDSDMCSDWAIVMNRVDLEQTLSKQLLSSGISLDKAEKYGFDLAGKILNFSGKPQTKQNMYEVLKYDLEIFPEFMKMGYPNYSAQEVQDILTLLERYVEKNKKRFEKISSRDFITTIDNHSDNAYIGDKGDLKFFDIYIPLEKWRSAEKLYPGIRMATDFCTLGSDELGGAFLLGYLKGFGLPKPDDGLLSFYKSFFALIRASQLYAEFNSSGKRSDEAHRFWSFAASAASKIVGSVG